MFNEYSRVKIPALIHLSKLGYEYIPRANIDKENIDTSCNIFKNIFLKSISKLNSNASEEDLNKLLQDLTLKLENDDLGKSFYLLLQGSYNFKIIDFDNFLNNSLHCTTELVYKNGDDEFRPDITIIINGLPLIFIEVKKPNNPEGILAEYKIMSSRFKNEKFKKFINLTQFMIYSNNMEYDNLSLHNLQGAFYATCVKPKNYHNVTDDLKISFNYFREEEDLDYKNILKDIDIEVEDKILKDNNLVSLKNTPEFITNKKLDTPTNRILTSLLSKDRISFILKYAIAYVEKDNNNIEKHIMRYPQIFATLAIANKLNEGIKKGVIWHTQGSGKTALAFYNVKYLTDYYQKRNIIARFFFIVDRIDLLKQAQDEFLSRGLSVNTINSKEEFVKFMNKVTSINNDSGKSEITLVNIQKFSEDSKVCENIQYNINLQNIYFLDEVHRSYKPSGSFLSNLINSDKKAILIGLTGTPLLQNVGKDYSTRELFGDYIHKYYYNKSIDDGYTLRLIREEISTSYKMQLKQAIAKLQVKQGDINQKLIYSHENFIKPMLDYIINDLTTFRKLHDNISAMVICASSEQAKALFKEFVARYRKQIVDPSIEQYNNTDELKAILILHDMYTKDIMNKQIKAYKNGFYNIVFVYNMLLTGFDAPILKKLYIARKIENHNLLQALTRVNRPYNKFRHGYVVDFADISEEFKKTNEDYLQELVKEYDKKDAETFNQLFKTEEEILKDIENIKSILFEYNTKNKEVFSQQISSITDRNRLLEIIKALRLAKELYNIIIYNDDYKLLCDKLDFKNLSSLYIEVQNRLNLIRQSEILNTNNTNLINIALEDIIFKFKKLSEAELIIADKLQDIIRKTREALNNNFDKKDKQFILLKEEFERIFRNKDFNKLGQDEINITINKLEGIYKKVTELNYTNNLFQDKYSGDKKYAVVHKRLLENNKVIEEYKLFDGLIAVKDIVDTKIVDNKEILNNEHYFKDELNPIIMRELQDLIDNKNLDYKHVNNLILQEYMNEYKGILFNERY